MSLIKRKNKIYKEAYKPKVIKILKPLNIIIELFYVIGTIGTIILAVMMINNNDFSFKYLLYLFLTMLIISTIMVLFNLVFLVYSLVKKTGSIRVKLYYGILNIANLVFIWLLYYFNLLGYKV